VLGPRSGVASAPWTLDQERTEHLVPTTKDDVQHRGRKLVTLALACPFPCCYRPVAVTEGHMKARILVLAFLVSAAGLRADSHLAAPESVGFSADGLKTLQQTMRALVDDGQLANITTLVARHGKIVYLDAYGVQDLATKTPVRSDTIFRLASMTKPIVGV